MTSEYSREMEFCPDCKSMMMPNPKSGLMICRKCGCKIEMSAGDKFVSKTSQLDRVVPVLEGDIQLLPTANARCPECGNNIAYVEMKQTRAADESPTRFLTCTKCRYRWRRYE
jgi:DNA-directed RNA polymerase subunit M